MKNIAELALYLFLVSTLAHADATHYYPWLPFENFPTPTENTDILRLLHGAVLLVTAPTPDFPAVIEVLQMALALAQNDHTPQPKDMFADPTVNQQLIGQISLAIDTAHEANAKATKGFIDLAITGGSYDPCHATSTCAGTNPKG
jgi:hypothetical protein